MVAEEVLIKISKEIIPNIYNDSAKPARRFGARFS